MRSVFISHSSADSSFVKDQLVPALQRHGIDAWVCSARIPTAAEWEREISRALDATDWFLVILTPAAIRSEWVRAEVHWALERRRGRVVPIMLRTCDPAELNLRLGLVQFIDFRGDLTEAEDRLCAVVLGDQAPAADDERTTLRPVRPNAPADETVIVAHRERCEVAFEVLDGPGRGRELRVSFGEECLLGRARAAQLCLHDDQVSRTHARLSRVRQGGRSTVMLTDMGSSNGTYLNGARLLQPTLLKIGDEIEMGATRLRVLECH